MDGHEAAQERVSNPTLSWIRSLALAVEREGKLDDAMIASEIVELCQNSGLEIPGAKGADDDQAKRQIGVLMKRVFNKGDEIKVDGYAVRRGQREYRKPSGDLDCTPEYTFIK